MGKAVRRPGSGARAGDPPQISGRETARRLQERLPRLRTLYVSGYAEDAILRHGLIGEGIAFLRKPFTLDELGELVRKVLDGR